MLGRDTDWRQGCVVAAASFDKLGLTDITDPLTRVVVISHDCDLPNESEADVEAILGTVVESPDSMLCHARNPRRLHITYTCEDANQIHVELSHANKKSIEKSIFVEAQRERLTLSDEEKRALKQWLAARYGRPAFPNAFENRLRTRIGNKTVEQRLAKLLVPASPHLVGVFFDLGQDRSTELHDGQPYYLSITVVYDATEGGVGARKQAESVAIQIKELFDSVFGTPDKAKGIGLESCTAVADDFMTLSDLRKVDQWRLEYLSLKDNDSGDFLAAGEASI